MGCLSLSAVIRHPSSGIGCHQPMRLKPPIRTQPHTLTRKLIPHLPLLACLLACLRGRCWGVEQFIQFLLLFETIGALSLCTPSARVSCALGRQADRHPNQDKATKSPSPRYFFLTGRATGGDGGVGARDGMPERSSSARSSACCLPEHHHSSIRRILLRRATAPSSTRRTR
ncbi:hypothetical protein JOL62DRAFT_400112 [Phyllosticta paracitricarpa]|uniref:Uncharacterized protein n=1 Tax=Phyllosticta paracitricarpa TaxID=2016321 RepID=A0ABR1NGB0_9PEZI